MNSSAYEQDKEENGRDRSSDQDHEISDVQIFTASSDLTAF